MLGIYRKQQRRRAGRSGAKLSNAKLWATSHRCGPMRNVLLSGAVHRRILHQAVRHSRAHNLRLDPSLRSSHTLCDRPNGASIEGSLGPSFKSRAQHSKRRRPWLPVLICTASFTSPAATATLLIATRVCHVHTGLQRQCPMRCLRHLRRIRDDFLHTLPRDLVLHHRILWPAPRRKVQCTATLQR